MSTIKKTTEIKFTIVNRIKALLQLGDEGKLLAFFSKFEKQAENDIKKAEANLSKLELDHKLVLQEFEDRIEDATQAVEDALLNVEVDQIQTNESQKAYLEFYLRNIKDKESFLSSLQEEKESRIKTYNERVESIKKDIATIQDRVKKILG